MEMSVEKTTFQATSALVKKNEVAQEQRAEAEVKPVSKDFYLSPVVNVDPRSRLILIQFRDSSTGDVVKQFPPEYVVKQYNQGSNDSARFVPEESLVSGGENSDQSFKEVKESRGIEGDSGSKSRERGYMDFSLDT